MGRYNRLANAFADDDVEVEAAPEEGDAEYAFEGYQVEFLEKVALMPIQG